MARVRRLIDVGAHELDADDVVHGERVFQRLQMRRERLRLDREPGEP